MLRLWIMFICMWPIAGFAQSYFTLSPRVGYESSRLSGSDINDFYRSYNDYYSRVTVNPFDTVHPTDFGHYDLGGSIRFMGASKIAFQTGLSVTYGTKTLTRKSEFQNGIITQTDWWIRDLNVQYDLGLSLFRVATLGAHIAGRFRRTEMALGYFYQDGSYSLGNEYDILGVYQTPTTTLDYGFSLGIRIRRWYLQVACSYASNAFSDDGLLTLMDFDKRQIRWNDLPRDYETWADDPANLDLETGFVRAMSFRSSRLNIGLEFSLFN